LLRDSQIECISLTTFILSVNKMQNNAYTLTTGASFKYHTASFPPVCSYMYFRTLQNRRKKGQNTDVLTIKIFNITKANCSINAC
jgi:hypothetical protein